MMGILAFRHLMVKKGRALFLLLGYGLGVGVMIVLLSVGQAMLDQSRDVSLVGGGQITVLPEGIDVEAMRTGGVSGMFFEIARARFVGRQLLGGPRHAGMVRAVAPAIENKLVYLSYRGRTVAARAGGEIPSRARAVGAGLDLRQGRWVDDAADSAWMTPTPGQLYDQLDRFHLPPVVDSSWGEWHYFNVTTGPREWWYLTYLVAGEVPRGRWGGQVLLTHRAPDGRYDRYVLPVPPDAITLDTAGADLALGASTVQQRDGVYHLKVRLDPPAGPVRLDLTLRPEPNRYFPPVDLREGEWLSGYVVPALSARASGRICVAGRCRRVRDAPAYHDHNWGVWRDVTWDWGAARGQRFDLLYGVVHTPQDSISHAGTGSPPVFVALVDSLGVRQIFRARVIGYAGRFPGSAAAIAAPASFGFVAARDRDTLRVSVTLDDVHATTSGAAAMRRRFLQMHGRFRLEGRVGGEAVGDSGTGFFETWKTSR